MLKLCVFGSGISYTLSPIIHKAVLCELGVPAEYGVLDVSESGFDAAVRRLLADLDGFNVTKPFKRAVIPYLSAAETGGLDAVNVVKINGGRATGYNTDADGFAAALTELTGPVRGMKTLMIGAGGAAEAVAYALSRMGADVAICNRTHEKAVRLAEKFGLRAVASAKDAGAAELIVNCATPSSAPPLPEGTDLGRVRYAYDLVYSPRTTRFMTACAEAGAKTSDGLGMLIYQAIIADEIFTGLKGDRAALRKAAERALEKEGRI